MASSTLYVYSLIAAVVLYVAQYVIREKIRMSKYKLPPTIPGGLPIVGNTFQMPPTQQGPWAKKMAEKYGEMFTVKIGGYKWVFLNSSRVVTDLMERRAAIYSSRPPFPMTQDIISGGSRIVLMPYSDDWRRIRKILHQLLAARQQDMYKPYQDLESKHLLWNYLHTPDRWWSENGRYANSVIMSVVFGTRSDLGNPDTVELFETMELFLENQQPGANIVDAFPVLANLPKKLQWWRPKGERLFEQTKAVYRKALDKVIRDTQAGTQKDCFAVDFLAIAEKQALTEVQKLFVLGTLMEAGSDTSRVTLGQIIAGAATYPDWVARARKELDAVCGDAGRLPTFEDKDKLPYITAVVKEGFRWRPNIAEIGAPTMLIQDDEYEGYKFPKGTVFTWNAWAIALSEKEYAEPERFWPERFLNEDLDNPLKGHWAFGPGRRVCVGWKVGEMNVWIAIARILYCFDFAEDPAHPIDTMTIPQITHNTAPFQVKVTPRSRRHAELIERDCHAASVAKY